MSKTPKNKDSPENKMGKGKFSKVQGLFDVRFASMKTKNVIQFFLWQPNVTGTSPTSFCNPANIQLI
jgi:hypothetical protein